MRNLRIISVALAAIAALTVALGAVFLSAARSVDFVTTGGAISAEATGLTAEEISEILNNGGFTLDENGTLGKPDGYEEGDFGSLWNKVEDMHDVLMGRDENGNQDPVKQILRYNRYNNSLTANSGDTNIIIELDLSAAEVKTLSASAFDAFLQVAIGYNAGIFGQVEFEEDVNLIDTATGEVTGMETGVNITETLVGGLVSRYPFNLRIILSAPADGGEIVFERDCFSFSGVIYSPEVIELDISEVPLTENEDGTVSGIDISQVSNLPYLNWITAEGDAAQRKFALKNAMDYVFSASDAETGIYVKMGDNGLAVPAYKITKTSGWNSSQSITVYAKDQSEAEAKIAAIRAEYGGSIPSGTRFYYSVLNENNVPGSAVEITV